MRRHGKVDVAWLHTGELEPTDALGKFRSGRLRPTGHRLLDFITEAVDPSGNAHIAYADDNAGNMLRVANQTSGPVIISKHH